MVTCPTKARTFGDLNDPNSEVSRMVKEEKLVRVNAPHVNTQPNIYYREGTRLLDWAVTPTLPGNVHMAREFWEKSGSYTFQNYYSVFQLSKWVKPPTWGSI